MRLDRIIEWAVLYATTGLDGAQEFEFETWRSIAADAELAVFRETVDLITRISEERIAPRGPAASVKERLLRRVREEKERETSRDAGEGADESAAIQFIGSGEGTWRELPVRGARIKELSAASGGVSVFLLEMDPGARLLPHRHRGVEEAFVLHGDLHVGDRVMGAGDYMRAGERSTHRGLFSEAGCRALLVTAEENFPREAIRAFDGLRRAWRHALDVVRSGGDESGR